MKQLRDILYKVPLIEVRGDMSMDVVDFFFDSRESTKDTLFVAVKGNTVDGHDFIAKAIENGAKAVVCEDLPEVLLKEVTYVKVRDAALSLAYIAANFFNNPADELKIVGITGTNGKTTCVTLLHRLFLAMGIPIGLISTVDTRIKNKILASSHTTPDPKSLHSLFRKMVDEGCEYCFMEVSSHAIHQKRVGGIKFSGAVFTNITHDHLDYHGEFKEYIRVKKELFDQLPSSSWALVNQDDTHASVMLQNSKAKQHGFSLKKASNFKAKIVENTLEGLLLDIDGKEVWFRMRGKFNAYNLMAVYGCAMLLDFDAHNILLELSRIEGVNGRFQTVNSPSRTLTAIVDYAHTPDALKNVLHTIRDIGLGDGKLITVVGCGGNRDKTKRPVMGKIACEYSDKVIFTSDNPRDEDPNSIITDILAGVPASKKKNVMTIENRKEAIKVACNLASEKDIILVAGKGHEQYQEIHGIKHPFDDREILMDTMKTLEQ